MHKISGMQGDEEGVVEEFFMGNSNDTNIAEAVPAIDLQHVDAPSGSAISQRNYVLHVPNEDWNDFLIEVRASILRKIRKRLGNIVSHGFPWHELLLGFAPLFLGASLGAISGNLKFTLNLEGIFFYIIFPMVFVGLLVSYFFVRKIKNINIGTEIKSIIEDVPNPEDTTRRN